MKEPFRSLAICLVLLIVGCLVWGFTVYNPVHSLALIRDAQIITGSVIDTYEDWDVSDDGIIDITHSVKYTFRSPDGREFTRWSGSFSNTVPEKYQNLPTPVEIEYLPSDPSINRIRGEGAQSMTGWVIKDIVFNLIILSVFCTPGVLYAGVAVRECKRFWRSKFRPAAVSEKPPSRRRRRQVKK